MSSSGLWSDIRTHPLALLAAVGLHLALLVLLSVSLSSSEVPEMQAPRKETVKAVVVDAAKVDAEINRLKQADQKKQQQAREQQEKIRKESERAKKQVEAEKQRLAELKKKQAAEAKHLAEIKKQKEAERKKAEAEKQRLETERKKQEEQRKKREAEEKQRAEEAEKRRQEEAAELKRRLEEEERREQEAQQAAEHNRKLQSLRAQYVKLIEQKVERNWLRPATSTTDMSCEVVVTQTSLGDVISVNLQQCASDVAFQRSIERAVRKASPLPPPPSPEVFDREIHFTFRANGDSRCVPFSNSA